MPFNDVFGLYMPGRSAAPIDQTPVNLPRVRPTVELEPYTHEPIHASSQIRLIELLPPKKVSPDHDSNEFIRCKIHCHELVGSQEYEALSYTWGNMVPNLAVSIVNEAGDQAICTTPQLMMALRRLRLASRSRYLWIDQLSIDQSNNAEKSQQVSLMGEIYRKAQQVIIWLGEPSTGFVYPPCDPLHILTEMINTLPKEFSLDSDDAEALRNMLDFREAKRMETVELQRSSIIHEFLGRQWFQRAWVFQEASLARNLFFLYGTLTIPFDDIKRLANAVYFLQNALGYRKTLATYSAGFEMIQSIHEARFDSQATENPSLPKTKFLTILFNVLRKVEAFNKRDLIYAFLAFHDLGPQYAIKPDYDLSEAEVWRTAAETIAKGSQSLDIFAALPGDRVQEIELPSWVPYWSDCFPDGAPIAMPNTNFRASRGLPHIFKGADFPGQLIVRGKIIDHIESFPSLITYGPAGAIDPLSQRMLRDTMWGQLCGIRGIPSDQVRARMYTIETEFMRVVLADGANGPEQPLRNIFDFIDASNSIDDVAKLRQQANSASWSDEQKELVREFEKLEALKRNAIGKKVFLTGDVYPGMAPSSVKIGDFIAIIHGSKTPCILRDVGDSKHRIIGQCYLDGWMYGTPPKGRKHSTWWEEEQDDFVLV